MNLVTDRRLSCPGEIKQPLSVSEGCSSIQSASRGMLMSARGKRQMKMGNCFSKRIDNFVFSSAWQSGGTLPQGKGRAVRPVCGDEYA